MLKLRRLFARLESDYALDANSRNVRGETPAIVFCRSAGKWLGRYDCLYNGHANVGARFAVLEAAGVDFFVLDGRGLLHLVSSIKGELGVRIFKALLRKGLDTMLEDRK